MTNKYLVAYIHYNYMIYCHSCLCLRFTYTHFYLFVYGIRMFFSSIGSKDDKMSSSFQFTQLELEYLQTVFIILCCTVYLLKELIPEFKDKLTYAFTFLFRAIVALGFLYSVVIHTPWKGVLESFVSAWMQKLFR
jgi:hypothetical protein